MTGIEHYRGGDEAPASVQIEASLTGGTGESTSHLEDVKLVVASKAGDQQAFDSIVSKYQHRVYNHCLQIVRDDEQSYDLAQEVFLRVFRNIDKYQHSYELYTWIYRITVNCCLDYLRKIKRQPARLSIDTGTGEDADGENWTLQLPDERHRPDWALLDDELRRVLHETIGRLAIKLRKVILLRDVKGYRYDEIAEILDCPVSTVKSRIYRARNELRKVLSWYVQ